MTQIFQILVLVFFLVLAAFFAGSETGVYRLSRFRLRLGIEQRRPFYAALGETITDSSGLVLSMLIGTNLTHYVVTSIVTFMWLTTTQSDARAELYAMFTVTPILFIFCELLPKNIYFHHADSLMPRFSPALWFFHKLFSYSGAVPLLKLISNYFARLTGTQMVTETVITAVQRHHIRAIIRDTREEGVLSTVQSDIINRLVGIPQIRISSIMTPVDKVQMVPVNTSRTELFNRLKQTSFTRLPVYDGNPGNIIGFINIYEALGSSKEFTGLRAFIKPIAAFSADSSVIDAMNRMRKENHKIVLITKGHRHGRKRPVGIVTMKDLVEELTGELAEW